MQEHSYTMLFHFLVELGSHFFFHLMTATSLSPFLVPAANKYYRKDHCINILEDMQ